MSSLTWGGQGHWVGGNRVSYSSDLPQIGFLGLLDKEVVMTGTPASLGLKNEESVFNKNSPHGLTGNVCCGLG